MNNKVNSDFRARQKQQLLSDIASAKSSIDAAHSNFNMVSEPGEVDVYIYRLRAAESRYDSLMKKLKELC